MSAVSSLEAAYRKIEEAKVLITAAQGNIDSALQQGAPQIVTDADAKRFEANAKKALQCLERTWQCARDCQRLIDEAHYNIEG